MFIAAFTVRAQTSAKLTAALKKGMPLLDSAKTTEQYTRAAKYFENVANAEQKEWLPQYYTAYSYILAGINSKGTEEAKDALYNKALTYIAKANALTPNNSEVYVLKGYATFMKMSVEPQARAMQMIPEADEYLVKATQLDSDNPRAYLVRGQNTFYTPQMFGGGKDLAKPLLTASAGKYAKATVKGLEPNWGKTRCAVLLKKCE